MHACARENGRMLTALCHRQRAKLTSTMLGKKATGPVNAMALAVTTK